jgi:hypothetical protein
MNNDEDLEQLEQDQLEYMRRNSDKFAVQDVGMYPDILKKPLDTAVILDPEQEKVMIDKIKQQLPYRVTERELKNAFSFKSYLKIISSSFVNIMDDLLNFDGDLESFTEIFTKDDRMIFVGTIVMIISIMLLMNRKSV